MIITADKHGSTDSIYHSLNGRLQSKYPVVIVSWVENFVFNDELLKLKNYVLLCMCEYGWNFSIKQSHVWGKNTDKKGYGDGRYSGEEWDKFDNWVKGNPFKVMFKRELLKDDVSETVQPLEYPCLVNEWEIQTEEQFNSRPVNVFQYWGRSNEMRLRIHGQIWLHSYEKGFQVCDNLYYINHYLGEEQGEKWITLWIPHYARVDINELLKVNNLSKLSLSWAGAGFKCFRTAEAAVNSIMVMNRNKFSWTFDWNEDNCILVEQGNEIEGIERALKRKDLYKVYKAGVENNKKYMLPNYLNHLENIINNA
jgi:hypothetical protein